MPLLSLSDAVTGLVHLRQRFVRRSHCGHDRWGVPRKPTFDCRARVQSGDGRGLQVTGGSEPQRQRVERLRGCGVDREPLSSDICMTGPR